MKKRLPLYKEIPYERAVGFGMSLSSFDHVVFFHSAMQDTTVGRYSFVALDPFCIYQDNACDQSNNDCIFDCLSACLAQYQLDSIDGLPPFQGGLAGYISYDVARQLEVLPSVATDEFSYPTMILGCYDTVVAMDHEAQLAWVISTGFPELSESKRDRVQQSYIDQPLYLAWHYEKTQHDQRKINSFQTRPHARKVFLCTREVFFSFKPHLRHSESNGTAYANALLRKHRLT